jgi:secondary thiamine-phosphate synthase enzyme
LGAEVALPCVHSTFTLETRERHQIIDITAEVARAVADAGVRDGLCAVYTPHATAAITVNENADPNIGVDFLAALRQLVPDHDGWLHDRIDDNAAAHIKSALIGPSQTIPIVGGRLALGTWQNVFYCELDGPRAGRKVIVSVLS